MDITKFNNIKQKALDNKVPIVMDDTLDMLKERLKRN